MVGGKPPTNNARTNINANKNSIGAVGAAIQSASTKSRSPKVKPATRKPVASASKPPSTPTVPTKRARPSSTAQRDVKRARTEPASPNARPNTSRQLASRNTINQQANVNLTLAGMPIPADIKVTNVVKRLFGQEIQCVMHSFGETRACTRDTLELVEDAVRAAVRCVIAEAVAVHGPTSDGGPVVLEVKHIAHIIRRDPRAMYRLNQTIRSAADQYGNRPEAAELRKYSKTRAELKPWESIAALADLTSDESSTERQQHYMQDPWKYCTWRAYHVFRSLMPAPTFNDYMKCRSTNLVTGISRSQWSKIVDQPRFMIFRRWLDLSERDEVKISLPVLYALGHIAWECIGVLTQTALIQQHFDDINAGRGEYRCVGWSYARHLLAALGHGIATAVLVPLTDAQLILLKQEVEKLPMLALMSQDYWRGSKTTSSKSLLPAHIREALRRNDFADSILLCMMRGNYSRSALV